VAVETTLVLVKPDGIRRGLAGGIVSRFERRGMRLRGRPHRAGAQPPP